MQHTREHSILPHPPLLFSLPLAPLRDDLLCTRHSHNLTHTHKQMNDRTALGGRQRQTYTDADKLFHSHTPAISNYRLEYKKRQTMCTTI